MSNKELLLNEIEQTPDPLLDEVLDYLRLLKSKLVQQSRDTAVASESALEKDWLRPEEDQAWQSLVRGDVVVVPFPFSNLSQAKPGLGGGPPGG
jgi:hypothetical protein